MDGFQSVLVFHTFIRHTSTVISAVLHAHRAYGIEGVNCGGGLQVQASPEDTWCTLYSPSVHRSPFHPALGPHFTVSRSGDLRPPEPCGLSPLLLEVCQDLYRELSQARPSGPSPHPYVRVTPHLRSPGNRCFNIKLPVPCFLQIDERKMEAVFICLAISGFHT